MHLKLAWEARRSGAHHFGASQLAKFGVEYPNSIDVTACEQRLHSPAEADARFQVVQVFRVEADFDNTWLVNAVNAGILEMLIVDLALTCLLNDLILLAGEQGPKHMRLRLLTR